MATREGMIKHKDVVAAFIAGKDIQMKRGDGQWVPCDNPYWHGDTEYRVAPDWIEARDLKPGDIYRVVDGTANVYMVGRDMVPVLINSLISPTPQRASGPIANNMLRVFICDVDGVRTATAEV